MTSLLSVHSVQFSKGISNSSETFPVNLRPNTAAMSSNLWTDVTFVGATFAFAAINRTVTSPSSYLCRTVIECLIINSYFIYADFFCLSIFFRRTRLPNFCYSLLFVIHYKTNSVKYSFLITIYCKLVDVLKAILIVNRSRC